MIPHARGNRLSGRLAITLAALLAIVSALAPASASAAPAPRWQISSVAKPTNFAPNDLSGRDTYLIVATNVGNAPTDGSQVTIAAKLPTGVTATKAEIANFELAIADLPSCTTAPLLQCTYPGTSGFHPQIEPEEELEMIVHVAVHRKEGTLANTVTVSGGGAPEVSATSTNRIDASPAPLGEGLAASDLTADGSPATQAGAHPGALTTTLDFSTETTSSPGFEFVPSEDPRDLITDLPPGLVGNPLAVPRCPLAKLAEAECPTDSQVGIATTKIENLGWMHWSIFNLKAQPGVAGELAIVNLHLSSFAIPILEIGVRSAGGYGLRVISPGGIPALGLEHISVTIWGVPAAHSHDIWRGRLCGDGGCEGGGIASSEAEHPRPFLTNPTSCTGEPLTVGGAVDSWEHPGVFSSTSATLPPVDGCNQVPFEPTLQARPTTNLADSPSGLDVDLHLPLKGFEEPEATAESNLKDTTVTLPPGLLVNPASANGLGACSAQQFGLTSAPGATPITTTEGPATCPDASKLGKVEVDTPVLDHPLPGAVYLAKPFENPFGSLLALYIAINDPQTGVVVKLAGKVTPDPQTGQLTATFEENPQLPFEHFRLHFFGGAQGTLRTPATCGTFTTTSQLTPWSAPESGPPATPTDEFQIASPPSGTGTCPQSASQEPNAPVFHAGTESPQAGIYSPFSLKLVRQDGEQELRGIDTTLPPGLVGRLAGVGECSDAQLAAAAAKGHSGAAEQAGPSCPLTSEVGTVDVGAGAGPDPIYVAGHAYLAGPYKGAPLSLAIITPAVAGPFDLGTVVVRTALFVDPFTAQIHAVSDPIPTILEGIPLDVRSVTLKMARPNFTLNPTNCNELGFTGSALSVLGQAVPLTERFQVGGCAALAFKPKLSLKLKGGTKRHSFPALTAVVSYPKKGSSANIASAQVTLPHSEFLEQGHIKTVCTRPQLASHTCPAASIYGHATAVTPLLDKPLSGPVYLGVGFGHTLPDLVADLNGQIEVLLHGKVDTGRKDGLRNTFEVVPDAPVSKFTLSMFGGKKGLIVNSENLCGPRAKTKALAKFVGQNGKTIEVEPTVHNSCKKGHKKGKNKKRVSHRLGTSHR